MTSFIKKIFIYSLGNIGVILVNFFLVPFYTFYLSKSEFGYYDIIVTTAALLVPVVSMQVEVALLRWVISENNIRKRFNFIQNSLLLLVLSIILFSLLFIIVNRIYEFENAIFIYFYYILFFIYPFFKQLLRSFGFSKKYIIVEFFYSILFCTFTIILVSVFKFGVKGLLISNIISLIIVETYIFIRLRIKKYFGIIKLDSLLIKDILRYSVPLVFNALNIWFFTYSIKYIIVILKGYESNGLFAVALKFASIIQIINSIFYLAWQEEAFSKINHKNSDKYFQKVLDTYIAILFIFLIFIVSFQNYLVPLIIDKNYYEVTSYIPILSLGYLIISIAYYYGVIFQCLKQTLPLSISSFLSSIFIIIVGLICAKFYNLYIASFSFLLGSLILLAYRIFKSVNLFNIEFPYFRFILYIIISLIYYLVTLKISLYYIIFLYSLFLFYMYLSRFKEFSTILFKFIGNESK